MYRQLDPQQITATLRTLKSRILERFPQSNLNNVCAELLNIAAECDKRLRRISRPRWMLRLGILLLILGMAGVTAVAVVVTLREVPLRISHALELIQGLEAGVNETILLMLALFFLFSLEIRLKRRDALKALHELRSLAHVIDMHQLVKDPEAILSPAMATPSSPRRSMTRFELARYLDYCSEMLSLTAKLAALHGQYLRDPVVLNGVNDVESLTGSLTQKIWEKIVILDTQATGLKRSESESAAAQP